MKYVLVPLAALGILVSALALREQAYPALTRLAKNKDADLASRAEELLEKAWDENADPFTNAVRVAVMTLRCKLGDPPVIETVPTAGYRMQG